MGGPISFVSGSNSHQTMEEAPNSSIFFLRYLLVAAPHHHEHNGWRREGIRRGRLYSITHITGLQSGAKFKIRFPFHDR